MTASMADAKYNTTKVARDNKPQHFVLKLNLPTHEHAYVPDTPCL